MTPTSATSSWTATDLVDGVSADLTDPIDVLDPATGHPCGEVSHGADAAERAGRAADAAARALPGWADLSARQRADILLRAVDLLADRIPEIARILAVEAGKRLPEAEGEVRFSSEYLRWFAEEVRRPHGEFFTSEDRARRQLSIHRPLGVVASPTPWNFPISIQARKVAPALAAGCTVVVKPAEQTPLTALALARLAHAARLPAGVLNVLTGDPLAIGGALTASSRVRKLSFTGSTEVGRLLMAQCASTIKKLSLELGGNAPFIVFDDADVAAAVDGAIVAKYRNTGQTCVCANRLLVQDGIYENFVALLARRVESLKVGPGCEEGVAQGPLIDAAAVAKVEAHIADAVAQGARVITGGSRHARGGTFFEPTVLADVTPSMRIAREETFGPVAPVFRFAGEAEAIRMANDTEFGLAAYFYARDIARCLRVGEALEYGMIGVNTGLISNEVAPFGGVKQSGIGREGSRHGLDEYLEIKYLCFNTL